MTEYHARLSPALVETVAGFSAGIGATLAGHPFDVIKTRLQSISAALKTSLLIPLHQRTTLGPANSVTIFQSLVRNKKPLGALYRGFTPNLAGNASSWAIFFYSKSVIEGQLQSFHSRNIQATSTNSPLRSGLPTLSALDYFLASFGSGLITAVVTNPIWVLKTRMLSSDAAAVGAYPSMWAGAKHVWHREGWRGYYRGLGVSCLGTAHGGVQFAVYEPLKQAWLRYVAREKDGNRKHVDKIGNEATLAISGAAKVVAGVATYPYQVVRSRLQTYDAEERFGKGVRGVMGKVMKEDGIRGFYKGLGPSVVRVLPATWTTFLVYENVRYYLPKWVE